MSYSAFLKSVSSESDSLGFSINWQNKLSLGIFSQKNFVHRLLDN